MFLLLAVVYLRLRFWRWDILNAIAFIVYFFHLFHINHNREVATCGVDFGCSRSNNFTTRLRHVYTNTIDVPDYVGLSEWYFVQSNAKTCA